MGRTIHAPRPAGLKGKEAPAPRLLDTKWLSVEEVIKLLPSYTRQTIYHLARSRELEFSQPLGPRSKMWISERSVEAFLARGHKPAAHQLRAS